LENDWTFSTGISLTIFVVTSGSSNRGGPVFVRGSPYFSMKDFINFCCSGVVPKSVAFTFPNETLAHPLVNRKAMTSTIAGILIIHFITIPQKDIFVIQII
jgi:hypothetical protein